MLIDSHAHLTDDRLRCELDGVLQRAAEARVEVIVTVGTDAATSREVAGLVTEVPGVVGSVGVHPHDATSATEDVLSEMAELAAGEGIVAIGETGLDFYRDLSPRDRQEMAFIQQIHLARELSLPIVVHSREAPEETLRILRSEGEGELRGVVHCFSGDMAMADRVLEMGLHVGIAGPVTYPNAGTLRQVASRVPLDRLLVETDAPYLAPQTHRGTRNEPAYVRHVAERIAQLRDIPFEEVARSTTQNAVALFGIELTGSRSPSR